jgi:hypothetical protein
VLWAATFVGNEDRSGAYFTPMFIPVLGPFIAIYTSDAEDIGLFTLVLDGAAQATGIALVLAGALGHEKFIERTAQVAGFDPRPEVFIGPRSAALRWQF